jgi:MFS family permease
MISTLAAKPAGSARTAAMLLFGANGFTFATWAASIPRIADRLGLTPAQVAVAAFTISLGAIVVMPFVGGVVERHGARRVAFLAAPVVPLLLPFVVEAPTFAQLLVVGFVFGAFVGYMDVAMNSYAVAAERAAGASWISQVHGVWSVANVAGSLCVVALVARHVPLPAVACAAIVAAAIAFAFRFAPAVATPHDDASAATRPTTTLVALGVLAAIGLLVEGAMADWSALYLHRDLHASATFAPLAYAAFAFAMTATRFVGDASVIRYGRARVLGGSGIVAALALAAGLAATNLVVVACAFAIVGIGCANIAPILFTTGGRLGGGRGVATVTGIGYASFLIGPAAIGGAASIVGLRLALTIVAACAAAVAVAATLPRIREALAYD